MTQTVIPTNDRVIRFQNKFFKDYIRNNRFAKVIGADENSPIQLVMDLTKTKGQDVMMFLVNELGATVAGGGIRTGYQTLKGYETNMNIRSYKLTVELSRFAVTTWESDEQFSAIDLIEAKDMVLQDNFKTYLRDRVISAMGSISTDGYTHVAYGSAIEADKDTWLVNNQDRIIFGQNLGSGYTVHATGVTTCDTTNDILNEANLRLLKDQAKAASPKIRPIKIREDEEWFVVYTGTKNFRNAQTALASINREAWVRAQGENNPLFTGGDLIYDGMVIKEIPEITQLAGTPGASATTAVAPAYLVGAQALGYGVALKSKMIQDKDDYGEVKGAGIKMLDKVAKVYFGAGASDTTTPKQNGIVTGYYAVV